MVRKHDLGTLIPLARGGQGTVYRVPDYEFDGRRNLVYKEYSRKIIRSYGDELVFNLQKMVDYPSTFAPNIESRFYRWVTFPRQVVVAQSGQAVGYVMDEINDKYRGSDQSTTTEVLKLFNPKVKIEQSLGFAPTPEQLASLTANLLIVLKFMHEHGVVVGDISARNIVFTNPGSVPPTSPLGPMQVKFLDADSFRIQGESAPMRQADSPNYETPETLITRKKIARLVNQGAGQIEIDRARTSLLHQTQSSDVYKLGLIILRVWDRTETSFAIQDSAKARGRMEKVLGAKRARAIRSMTDTLPRDRPSMKEVLDAFKDG